jgi:hypothetical protein
VCEYVCGFTGGSASKFWSRRTTIVEIAKLTNQCADLPIVGIITSHSYSFYSATAAVTTTNESHHDTARTTWHNGRFGMEAAKPTAPIPKGVHCLTLSRRHHRLSGTLLPYVFLQRTQLTTTPKCLSTCCDLNGRQW